MTTLRAFAMTVIFAACCAGASVASAADIRYVYDDLGRLVAVIDQQGNVATYTYDAVGNLLEIGRVNAADFADAIAITYFAPARGMDGTPVTIFGKGFSATPSLNTVTFNGTAAAVTASDTNTISTSVPIGATTGPIRVVSTLGTAISSSPFTVGATITVNPTTATITGGATQQFQAQEGGAPTTAVTWAVNGITGGDATTGTISSSGVYTAPLYGLTQVVTVAATQQDDRASSASATVTVLGVGGGYETVNRNVGSAVSILLEDPNAYLRSRAVGVAIGPAVSAVSPTSGVHGTTVTVTLTGGGFTGATSVRFLLGSIPDGNLTVANLSVSGDGTQATVDVTIASNAALGPRVTQVMTPSGNSTALGTDGNNFNVQ